MVKKTCINSYITAFLMSLAIHIFILFLVISFSKVSSDAQKIVVIDLTLLDHVAAETGTSGHGKAGRAHESQSKLQKAESKEVNIVIEQKIEETKEEKKERREKISTDVDRIPVEEQVPPVEVVSVERGSELNSAAKVQVADKRSGTISGGGQGTGAVESKGDGHGTTAKHDPGAGNIDGVMKGYLRSHLSYIKEMIQKNIAYPNIARRNGWAGKVTVSFIIAYNGRVREIEVVRRSGFDCLDRNAVEAVKRSSPFPHPPLEARIIIPILYELH